MKLWHSKRRRKPQAAFALVELVVVITIIGVLAAIAVPQYRNYVIRSKVAESMKLAAAPRVAVGAARQSLGRFAGAANSSYSLPEPQSIAGEYVKSVIIGRQGKIIVVFNNNLGSKTINGSAFVLTPRTVAGSIVWTCEGYGKSPTPQIYLPASCR